MAAQRRLSDSFPAVAGTIPRARAAVANVAAEAGLRDQRLEGLRLAVSEAVTNVVRHAYRDRGGRVWLGCCQEADELWVRVWDEGCGHRTPSPDPGLGLGLALISHECDKLVVSERERGGTELRMCFRLSGTPGRLH